MAIDVERSLVNAARQARRQTLGEPLGDEQLARDLAERWLGLQRPEQAGKEGDEVGPLLNSVKRSEGLVDEGRVLPPARVTLEIGD